MSSTFYLDQKHENSVYVLDSTKGLKCLLCDLMQFNCRVPLFAVLYDRHKNTLKCTESCPLENN